MEVPSNISISPLVQLQLDAFTTQGAGVADYQRVDGSGLFSGFSIARVRLGLRGEFADRWSFLVVPEFGASNNGGPGQTLAFRGGAVIASLTYRHSENFAVTFGQFPVPLTLEVPRPTLTFDFMEPSRVSALVTPSQAMDTGIMVSGRPGQFIYAVGMFNGDGRSLAQSDRYGDVDALLAVRFNAKGKNRMQLGVTGRYGLIDPRNSWRTAPNLITGRGYAYWSGSYFLNGFPNTGPEGGPVSPQVPPTEIRIMPSGAQRCIGPNLIIELGDLSIHADAQRIDFGRREVTQRSPEDTETLRVGSLTGFAYYATLGYWLISPSPRVRNLRWEWSSIPDKRPPPKPQKFTPAVQALVRWEQLLLKYDSIARSPAIISRGVLDSEYTTRIRADIVQASVSYWLATHLRIYGQADWYHFPGKNSSSDPRRIDNQAIAPGAVVPGERGTRNPAELPRDVTTGSNPSYFQPSDPSARSLYEFSVRAQVWF